MVRDYRPRSCDRNEAQALWEGREMRRRARFECGYPPSVREGKNVVIPPLNVGLMGVKNEEYTLMDYFPGKKTNLFICGSFR
ncbi:hypothetical protein Nepgr_017050 [Nepenthes gracilis]|uniref:Uncharacterized protein n=1 Tax=Nepenthes gracilis TaxID=150966 RepID=A0AAD3XSQ9_NEPGR|nr:hypothetical protein Nepgr_017050 [Nepenthes gracilis]